MKDKKIVGGLYNTFATNDNLSTGGAWIDFEQSAYLDGKFPRFKVVRTSQHNKQYHLALKNALAPYKKQIDNGTIKEEVAKKVMRNVFIDHVLKDWRDIRDEHGVEIIFNRDNVNKLLNDLPDLEDVLMKESADITNFQRDEEENIVKN